MSSHWSALPSVSRSRRDDRAAGVASRDLYVCRIVGRQAAGKVRRLVMSCQLSHPTTLQTSLLYKLAESGSKFLLGGERGRRTAIGTVHTSKGPKWLLVSIGVCVLVV